MTSPAPKSSPLQVDALNQFVVRRSRKTYIASEVVRLGGAPASGLSIHLTRDEQDMTTTTDDQGKFKFLITTPGTYRLTIDADGYRHVDEEIVVTPDDPANDLQEVSA